jgi:hypothetical protein
MNTNDFNYGQTVSLTPATRVCLEHVLTVGP